MQTRLSGSVKVIWLDREKVLASVRDAVERLVRSRPEVVRVILFGSMAKGGAVPGSDVDLIVVLSRSRRKFLDRIPRYVPEGIPVGVDVFPYTEAELRRMLANGNPFVKQALSEGITLFDRGHEAGAGAPSA